MQRKYIPNCNCAKAWFWRRDSDLQLVDKMEGMERKKDLIKKPASAKIKCALRILAHLRVLRSTLTAFIIMH